MNFWLSIFIIVIGLFRPFLAKSQSYQAGYQLYISGDYAGAESAFKKALNSTKITAEEARIYKMLGISQYMQGKRIEASDSFKLAKEKNPAIKISSNEVLDESVLPFFDSIEGPPIPKDEPVPVNNSSPKKSATPHVAYSTSLIIKANVNEARIVIDGKIATTVGHKLLIEPGLHELDISAEGYDSIKQPVEIKPNIVNSFTVNLIKSQNKKALTQLPTKKEEESVDSNKQLPKKQVKVRKESIKRKKVKVPRTKPTLITFMPFGMGQYANDHLLLGLAFTVGQSAGLALGFLKFSEGNRIVDETNAELTKREEIAQKIVDPNEQNRFFEEEVEAYKEEQDKKAQAAYNQSALGFALFGSLWLASIAHAYLSGNGAKEVTTANKSHQIPQSQLITLTPYPSKNSLHFALQLKWNF